MADSSHGIGDAISSVRLALSDIGEAISSVRLAMDKEQVTHAEGIQAIAALLNASSKLSELRRLLAGDDA